MHDLQSTIIKNKLPYDDGFSTQIFTVYSK